MGNLHIMKLSESIISVAFKEADASCSGWSIFVRRQGQRKFWI